ncbi:MAG: hypothetical protein WD577_04240 [Bacteroidales bacterium]
MKHINIFVIFTAVVFLAISTNGFSQVNMYRSSGAELIFSGADVRFNNTNVNANMRFTSFFHAEQMLNVDFGRFVGLFTGLGMRNIGFITEDLYQNVGFLNIDENDADWNQETKIKRRSYSLGVPLALKAGSMKKGLFFFAGGEYEWTIHYKQKLFIDGEKIKFSEWGSDRVNAFLPSVFAGVQLPKGMRVKFKYYMDDFLNPGYTGIDFEEAVDYSEFGSTGIFYVSLAFVTGKKR